MADDSTIPFIAMEPEAGIEPIEGKPICGSGEEVGEYDLPLHVAALFLVMAASIFGAGFPVVAKKVSWIKVPKRTFFLCKHFGTGVLVATAFVHLLPTAFGNLTDPCLPDLFTDQYPAMPGVIMMAAMFALFVIEMWLNGKMGGHSHGGPMGFESQSNSQSNFQRNFNAPPPMPAPVSRGPVPPRPPRYTSATDFEIEDVEYEKKMAQKMYEEKMRNYAPQNPFDDKAYAYSDEPNPYADRDFAIRSQMPPWFIVFYEQYCRQRLEMFNMVKEVVHKQKQQEQQYEQQQWQQQAEISTKRQTLIGQSAFPDSPYIDVETGQPVDPLVYKRMSMNITLLEGGILFHSVFVGMTISITIDGFIILLVAMLFHQAFEGLGLGSRIAEVPYKPGSPRPWVLVLAFGLTCPIGQALGLALRDTYDPNSAFGLIIVGVFNAISSGLLLYAAMVDLLAEDFLSEEAQRTMTSKDRKLGFFMVLLGAAGMSVVGAFA
ncbi:hypothetical protein VTJ49DRAFT_6484 [Mycothermus thermophilus]|uniref:Zinc-regulated transporter 2 n=1 Tax=Humicola insolens TaxID=85995 RepID=A0ABR3VKI1_HUMIN